MQGTCTHVDDVTIDADVSVDGGIDTEDVDGDIDGVDCRQRWRYR